MDDPKMDPTTIDISVIARDLKLNPPQVETTLQLLDAGNTIPFITRFRKDETGGLHEDQIQAIKGKAAQMRALADRKATVLRSIESQGELTDELKEQIQRTSSSRRLEDIYLPFKTRKQSKASLARQQGLAPLADEIMEMVSAEIDFATRATDFVRVDKGLNSVDDVIKGVGDLLAERFAEHEDLRLELRKLVRGEGKLTSTAIEEDKPTAESTGQPTDGSPAKPTSDPDKVASTNTQSTDPAAVSDVSDSGAGETNSDQPDSDAGNPVENSVEAADAEAADAEVVAKAESATPSSPGADDVDATAARPDPVADENQASSDSSSALSEEASTVTAKLDSGESATEAGAAENTDRAGIQQSSDATPPEASSEQPGNEAVESQPVAARKKKKKKKKKKPDPFRDYHQFEQSLKGIPHHRVLAINRGERSGKLRVKIKIDNQKANELAFEKLVPADHPSAEFLRKCAGETVSRSILPSIEREIRRELTEAAERHAVEVFSRNLKHLLLQPPIRNRVVLAVDPGFKRGCSVAVLDPLGRLLDSGHVFVVGNQQRREDSQQRLVDWIIKHQVDLVAIGNGTGCRQVEQLVSDALAVAQPQRQARYIIVNEAGTSIYSTSEVGREELPDQSPAIRSAMSIGRRLQDPLSELVKISPANIGVGMYQHDIKAKHLSESLDEIVQSCVNRVGVDVNTASASLLKYVSGLNTLTARRVIEYRNQHGRFNRREEFKNVNGVGETTYVQAAGFLRIHGGENPLDATSIHPESYPVAQEVLEKVNAQIDEIFPRWMLQPKKEETAEPVSAQSSSPASESVPDGTQGKSPNESPADVETANASIDQVDSQSAAGGQVTAVAEQAEVSCDDSATQEMPAATTESDASPSQPASATHVEQQSGEAMSGQSPDNPSANSEATKATDAETDSADETRGTPENTGSENDLQGATAAGGSSEPSPVPSAVQHPTRKEFDHRRKEIVKQMTELDIEQIAQNHRSGKLLVKDVIQVLKRPGWDPRDKTQKPIFRTGILKLDDLKIDMEISGQIVNVVDFGVFVDIGLGESSLVHVSQLSSHYIADPSRNFSVGDVIRVWVTEIDAKRRRVKLTAVRPGQTRQTGRKPKSRTDQRRNPAQGAGKPGRSNKPGKYEGRGPSKRRDQGKRKHTRRAPKPVKPITEEMLRGDEPMKSFSDLLQFVNQRPKKKSGDAKGKGQGE